ncbi:outer membrane beta-barrel protein [Paraferrimonas sedimenticola]|uniref:DUF481 domain-containing protein n=1 Tax=Paraferrimonas sedimenticola TaxID=375674 RepID=A0AA37RRE8_9GAMM|nr:outer membrane beta-barrel protein [Paraferrimonas sedimenticola]GLP94803.1 DUF481 domain-containing protein [Paraferrimonas sedimenticola]
MKVLSSLVGLALLASTGQAHAVAREQGWSVGLGAFWAKVDSKLNARVIGREEPYRVDLENDLALEQSKNSPFIEIAYGFNERHSLSLNYINLNRTGFTEGVTRPFDFTLGGVDYSIGAAAQITTKLDIDIYQLMYGYSFYPTENSRIALTAGAHIMRFNLGFSGDIQIIDAMNPDDRVNIPITDDGVEGKATAPLPDIGVYGSYQLAPDWLLVGNAQYFAISLDSVSGGLVDLRLELSKYFTDNFSVGLAYQYYQAEAKETGFLGEMDARFTYWGPELSLRYFF